MLVHFRNQPSDTVHRLPMVAPIQANTGQLPDALIAESGYCSTAKLEACEETWDGRSPSPPAGSSTPYSLGHHGADHSEASMPEDEWNESSDPGLARRSMPGEKQSWNRCFARSKEPEDVQGITGSRLRGLVPIARPWSGIPKSPELRATVLSSAQRATRSWAKHCRDPFAGKAFRLTQHSSQPGSIPPVSPTSSLIRQLLLSSAL